MSKWIRRGALPAVALLALSATGCGDFIRQGSGPSLATVATLEASSGAVPGEWSNTLASDVVTYVQRTVNGVETRVPTIFGDPGRVTVSVSMKDPAVTAPT